MDSSCDLREALYYLDTAFEQPHFDQIAFLSMDPADDFFKLNTSSFIEQQ
jgi:hypothetical protein